MAVLMVVVMGVDYSWPEIKVIVGMVVVVGLVVEMSVDYYSCLGEGVRDGGRLNMGVMNTNGRLRTKVPKYEKMPVP